MTAKQAKWAEQHDWWRSTVRMNTGGYKIVARCDISCLGIRYFESYDELRSWAGY